MPEPIDPPTGTGREPAVPATVLERGLAALGVSLAVHLALIFGISGEPPRLSGPRPPALQARIVQAQVDRTIAVEPEAAPGLEAIPEPAAPNPTADPPKPVAPEPAPAEETAAPDPVPSEQPGIVTIPIPVDTSYYPGRQLDVQPAALGEIRPEYPPEAATANVSGKVLLLLLIDETGKVDEVSVVEADPPGYFEESAVAAFRNARFVPGQKGGRTVRSRVLIHVGYDAELDAEPPVP